MLNIFKDIEKLKLKIEESKTIYLMSHVSPDGDSIGSVLALGTFIMNNLGKNINIVVKDEIPQSFRFMPNIDLIKDEVTHEKIDLLITLDCASIDRLGIDNESLENIECIINIDHHITNTKFGDINIIDPYASSAGQVVYDLINELNYEISVDVATCIYVSMSTDTGSFKYTNTSSKTHLIASKLLEKDIDLETINVELYQNRSIEKTRLLVECINNLELLKENKIGIVLITKEILDSCKARSQDAESIINFIRDIDTIQVACTIKEIDEKSVKVSLRSKRELDVSKVAMVFDGGGHAKAAGCTVHSNIQDAREKVIEEINKLF